MSCKGKAPKLSTYIKRFKKLDPTNILNLLFQFYTPLFANNYILFLAFSNFNQFTLISPQVSEKLRHRINKLLAPIYF